MAIAVRRFERSHDDLIIAGVCSGLANYTGAPSRIWRLGFGLLTLMSGAGVVLYVILWVLMPAGPKPEAVTVVGRPERATGPVGQVLNTSERFVNKTRRVVVLVGAVVAIAAKVPPIRDQAVETWHAFAGTSQPTPPLATHIDPGPTQAGLVRRPDPRPTPPTEFEPGLRERLIGVVALGADVEGNVMRSGDEQSLNTVFVEEALREELAGARPPREGHHP